MTFFYCQIRIYIFFLRSQIRTIRKILVRNTAFNNNLYLISQFSTVRPYEWDYYMYVQIIVTFLYAICVNYYLVRFRTCIFRKEIQSKKHESTQYCIFHKSLNILINELICWLQTALLAAPEEHADPSLVLQPDQVQFHSRAIHAKKPSNKEPRYIMLHAFYLLFDFSQEHFCARFFRQPQEKILSSPLSQHSLYRLHSLSGIYRVHLKFVVQPLFFYSIPCVKYKSTIV